jgi:sugar phosphate isomerase/epimerase
MQIAVNTGSLSHDTLEAVERAAALGFDAVEVNIQQAELRYDWQRKPDLVFYQRLGDAIRARQMTAVSVHHPMLSGSQVFSQKARAELLQLSIRAAASLGAPTVVVHPADLFTSAEDLETYFLEHNAPPVIAGFDEAWAQLANRGIRLALENVSYWRGATMTNHAERLSRVTDDLAIHAVLDVWRGADKPNVQTWVEKAGKRIVLLHLHEMADGREHQPPLSEKWAEWAPLLRGAAADACVLETSDVDGLRRARAYLASLWAAAEIEREAGSQDGDLRSSDTALLSLRSP